jgi:phage-related tail fiber protein
VPASFYNRLTDLGDAEYAAAFTNLTAVHLTHVALGDGNGAYYEPTKAQTALVREVYRASINSITIDATNANRVIVELIVPATAGGWWIREAGIFSSTGNLFVIGKFPATYKPLVSEGAGKELIVRLLFEVSSASVINLVIDPNLVVANVANITAQVSDHRNTETPNVVEIIKNDDYLKESLWYLETAAIVRVSDTQFTIFGDKTSVYVKNKALFFDQTTDAYGYVAATPTYSSGTGLTTVTVRGCTIDAGLTVVKYGQEVKNAPNGADDQYSVSTGSANAYLITVPAALAYLPGVPIFFKANFDNTGEATLSMNGGAAAPLKKYGSIALAPRDIKTGQIIMGLYDGVNVQIASGLDALPVGAELLWPTETPPPRFLEESGASLVRATYPVLFGEIGTMYGAADSTHFNLPDARGRHPRIWAHGQATDPDRASRTAPAVTGATISAGDHVGTNQADEFKAHTHTITLQPQQGADEMWGGQNGTGAAGGTAYTNTSSSTGGNETRPINTYRMLIIKAY